VQEKEPVKRPIFFKINCTFFKFNNTCYFFSRTTKLTIMDGLTYPIICSTLTKLSWLVGHFLSFVVDLLNTLRLSSYRIDSALHREIDDSMCGSQVFNKDIVFFFFFHILTVHLDIIKVFYSPTDAQVNCLKNNIKVYIKTAPTHFGAVTPSSGSALFVLVNLQLLKYSFKIHRCVVNTVVMWLHILVGPC
jgi:hypothetical protein